MIATALEAEVGEYVERFADERDEDGKRLVVRRGRATERRVTVGSGTVAIQAPRVNDKRVDGESGERQRFSSRILPAYARRSPKVNGVLPVLYLRGLSTGTSARRSSSCSGRTPRAVGLDDQPLVQGLGGRARAFPHALAALPSLRVRVRRRRPRLGAPGRGRPPLLARRDRCPRGRRQGAAGGRGRLPREHRWGASVTTRETSASAMARRVWIALRTLRVRSPRLFVSRTTMPRSSHSA